MLTIGDKVCVFHILFHCTIFYFFICIYSYFSVQYLVIIQKSFILTVLFCDFSISNAMLFFLKQRFSCVLKVFGTFLGGFLLWIDQVFCCNEIVHIQLPITCFDCTIICCAIHPWLLKQIQDTLMSQVRSKQLLFHKIVISIYNALWLNGINKTKNVSLLLYF